MTTTAVRLLRLAHKLESANIAFRSGEVEWGRELLAQAQADLTLILKEVEV